MSEVILKVKDGVTDEIARRWSESATPLGSSGRWAQVIPRDLEVVAIIEGGKVYWAPGDGDS